MEFLRELVRHLAQHSNVERANGNDGKANALACIVIGIILLPVPVLGLPLIGYGLYKLYN